MHADQLRRSGEAPDVSVIIVNRNTRELLRACIGSIRALPDAVSVEIIAVDNGSTDGSAEMVAREFPSVQLVRNQSNTGFAHPNNQGLALSRGRHLMLLNSDTEVRPHALERLVRFMDQHPEAGSCGPALFYADGRVQPSCRSFPTLWGHACHMLFLDRLFPRSRVFGNQETWFDHRHTAPVDQPMGAALLVRREVLDEVGPLDERFVIYYNDVDWCYRIHQAGWRNFFVHDAHVMHHGSVTTRNENRQMQLGAEMMRNHLDYFRKHFGERSLVWFRLWLLVGFAMRRGLFLAPGLLRRTEAARWRTMYHRAAIRVALTGDPEQFARFAGAER